MAIPTIPAKLTQASWAKEKGVVAKILKSDTGIGDLIGKVATAFGQVDWDKFDADKALAAVTTPGDVDAAKLAAGTEYKTKVEALRKAVTELRDKAKKTSDDWKKNKLIPNSSSKAAGEIATTAEQYMGQLKDNAPYVISFAKACDDTKKELVTEKVKAGEKPTNWDGAWWTARAPRGLADDKLAVKIQFFWSHYVDYPKHVNKKDDKSIGTRVNDLRQMIAGLDQGEAAIKATISRCKAGVHDNTKAALQHYLTFLPKYRTDRLNWIKQEKVLAQTEVTVKNQLQERIIGPGLDRL